MDSDAAAGLAQNGGHWKFGTTSPCDCSVFAASPTQKILDRGKDKNAAFGLSDLRGIMVIMNVLLRMRI